MQWNILGGAYSGESLNANSEECVNLYLEKASGNGRPALVGLPGLRKVAAVPNVPITFADDYANLLAFADPYDEEEDGLSFLMTTEVSDTAISSQTISGTLSGLSATEGNDLYYDDFDIIIGVFTTQFIYKDSIAVTSAAASSTQSWSKSVDFGSDAGVKCAYLVKLGTASAVTGIVTATKTFSVAADVSASYYMGRGVYLSSHSVMGNRYYTVVSSSYASSSAIVVNETVSDATTSGNVQPVDVRGVCWYNRSTVRSLNVPRYTGSIASGSIEDGRLYEVVGSGATATYSGTAYGEDATAGPFFYGSTTTTYTASGSPTVLDRSGRDLFDLQGYKTRVEDQAAALVSACAHNQSSDADDLCLKLLAMQYPLAASGEHSGNTGWFAWQYYTLGYADLSGNAKVTAPHAYFRTGPACMAGMALAFYCEKFTSGTHLVAAKAAIKALLDHLCDNYLITEAGHKQRWMFRGGKGRYVLESSTRVFDSAYTMKWASAEHNLWAWWLLKKADSLSLVTDSTVLGALSPVLTYATLATNIENRLYAVTTTEPSTGGYGLWNALKQRPVNSVWGVEIVEIDQSTKTITVNGYLNGLLLAGQTLSVEGNASNDAAYTVVSATNNGTVIANGSIVEGQYYDVLSGRVLYNGAVYFGGSTKQGIFQGVAGVSSYTAYGNAIVTVYQTAVVVEESITADQSTVYDGTLGNIHFEEYTSALAPIWLYMTFADEYGYNDRAKEAQTALAQFRIEDDTYSDVTGYRPYLYYVTDPYLDGVEYFTDNYVLPWSSFGWKGTEDRVSFEQSFGVVLAQAAVSDYGALDRDWTALYAGYDLAEGGWAHDLSEYSSINLRGITLASFDPPFPEYRIEAYASCGATAWAVIAQKPNGFLGASNTALTLENRSYKNEVRGLRVMGDYLYAVCGNVCVRFDTEWNYEVVSTAVLNTDFGPVTMADNGYQLMICDGTDEAYLYDSDLASWTKLKNDATSFFVGGGSVDEIDSYFVTEKPDSFQFYYSSPYSAPFGADYGDVGSKGGLEWDINGEDAGTAAAANLAVANGLAGNILRLKSLGRFLYVFKERSFEIYYDAGGTESIFRRSLDGDTHIGCSAKHSVAEIDEALFWLDEQRFIRRSAGANGTIISPDSVCSVLSRYSRVDDAVAFAYSDRGKKFYQITFPTAEATWLYEISTGLWTQRASYRDRIETDGRHRGNCHAYFNGQNIVGDFENGCLYHLDPDTYSDNGQRILATRTAPAVIDPRDRNPLVHSALEIEFEPGVGGIESDDSDPHAMLSYSDDGGHTFGNEVWQPLGQMGQYQNRAVWRRLGASRNRVYRIRMSAPVKRAIVGAWLR